MNNENDYFEKLKFEHELLNRRVTWLLTSQTILFAAYGLADKDDPKIYKFVETIPCIGLILSIAIFVGIIASIAAKTTIWLDHKDEYPEFGVRTWITIMGLTPDFFLPILFSFGWLQLGVNCCA